MYVVVAITLILLFVFYLFLFRQKLRANNQPMHTIRKRLTRFSIGYWSFVLWITLLSYWHNRYGIEDIAAVFFIVLTGLFFVLGQRQLRKWLNEEVVKNIP